MTVGDLLIEHCYNLQLGSQKQGRRQSAIKSQSKSKRYRKAFQNFDQFVLQNFRLSHQIVQEIFHQNNKKIYIF